MARISDGYGGWVSINDDDREQTVSSDEGLYMDMRRSRGGMRAYVRANREEIDRAIWVQYNATPENMRPDPGPGWRIP